MQPFHIHKTFLTDDDTEYPTYFPSNNNTQFSLLETPSPTIPQSTASPPQDTFDAHNDSIEVIVSDLEYDIDQDNSNATINIYSNTCPTSTSTLIQHAKSTQNSFIRLNNKLRLSLERDSAKNTNSYLMALLDLDNNNCNDNKNYEVTSIIEEEEDIESNEKKIIERHHTQSIQFKMVSFGVGNSHYTNNKSYIAFHTKAKSELLQLKLNIDVMYTSSTEEEKENIFTYN